MGGEGGERQNGRGRVEAGQGEKEEGKGNFGRWGAGKEGRGSGKELKGGLPRYIPYIYNGTCEQIYSLTNVYINLVLLM